MARFNDRSLKQAKLEVNTVNKKIKEGYPVYVERGNRRQKSALTAAAEELGLSRHSLLERIGSPRTTGAWKRRFKLEPHWDWKSKKEIAEETLFAPYKIEHEAPQIGSPVGKAWKLVSSKNNIFRFAAFGDFHAGSKYCRPEIRADLTKRAEAFRAQCIFDTGNWIEGEAVFNRYDLTATGVEGQCQHLAKLYPRTKIPTFAVTGADHEGWYAKREGIDVGRYCENVMRDAGHPWTNLGYMQADILLVNANTKKANILRVMHAGGGSSYAVSYRPQKIVESFEGGQKPAVLLIGHYHKLDAGLVRNVWYAQTGTCQDQTPFMAQKALEAHVGGVLIEIEQDPNTGAIISYTPQIRRYFDQAYYFAQGHGSNRWSSHGPITPAPRKLNQT